MPTPNSHTKPGFTDYLTSAVTYVMGNPISAQQLADTSAAVQARQAATVSATTPIPTPTTVPKINVWRSGDTVDSWRDRFTKKFNSHSQYSTGNNPAQLN